MKATLESLRERCRINDETGCWDWGGTCTRCRNGYINPVFTFTDEGRRRMSTTQRLAWVLAGGELKPKDVVWRTCNNDLCINPGHLKSGQRKSMHKWFGASGLLKGSLIRRVANKRNTESQTIPREVVAEIERRISAGGELLKDICEDVGVSRSVGSRIKTGKHAFSAGRQNLVRGASVFNLLGRK